MKEDQDTITDQAPEQATGLVPELEQEQVSADTEEQIEIGTEQFTLIGTTSKKGPKKGAPLYVLKALTDPKEFSNKVASAVGPEMFWKCVAQMIRTACKDATLQDISTATDHIPTDEGWKKAFIEWFTDESRRSVPHVKDIKEKLQNLFAYVSPLMTRAFDPKAEPLSEEEHNKMVQLSVEFSDLQAKLEKIQGARKGKKAAKVVKVAK